MYQFHTVIKTIAGLTFWVVMSAAAGPVVERGALLAASCASCHGTGGHSVGGTPSLAGLDTLYFIQQMQDFKSGKRPSTVMAYHASGYTDEEIKLLAAYFSSQQPGQGQ